MTVLSIQSAVALGYVGNAAAVPALQSLGQDVWRIDTVRFSNHPGYGRFAGRATEPEEIAGLIEDLGRIWTPGWRDAVLSGYLGQAATAAVIADAVRSFRQICQEMLYVLDPVIGDHGRIFVEAEIPRAIRESLLPLADIVIPNVSELGWLTDTGIHDRKSLFAAARALLDRGPSLVIVTGVREVAEIAVYGITALGAWRVASRYRNRPFNGTGDLFAALFTGHYLPQRDLSASLAGATAGLDVVTRLTEQHETRELALVAALPQLPADGAMSSVTRLV